MNIFYQEHDIERVFAVFVKGYRLPQGMVLTKHETTYDPRTGKVIFKLYATGNPVKKNGDEKIVEIHP
jgi:hypothetical protein